MCLKIFEILFLLTAIILTILLIIREFGITKKLSPMRASDFVSSIAGFLFAYIIFAILLSILISGWVNKCVMIFFAISPFIIGKLVTYQKVKIYSIIQILCVILSIVYLILI